jgi:hypothetical protein
VLVPGSLRQLGPVRRRGGLRAFESPAAFARSCLRLAVLVGVVGLVGLVDRLFALCLVLLLGLFAGLARLVALDAEDADGADDAEPDARSPADAPAPADARSPADAPAPGAAPGTVPRTFRLPASVGAGEVHLVGDFNGWSRTATPMRRAGPWFTAVVDLEPGASYRYRYLLDGDRWENDWAADAYLPNAFGSDDSVARTPAAS